MKLADLRLRTAISGAVLIGLMVPAGIVSWYNLSRQRELRTGELRSYHTRIVQILALGMQQAVWKAAPDLGEPLLDSVVEDRRIIRIVVSTREGVFLERVHRERRRGRTWIATAPIQRQGETIGRVLVELDVGRLEQVLAAQKWRVLAAAVAQLVLSLVIIWLVIHAKVLRPIRRLVRQAERLARGQLDEPLVWRGRDELGRLGQSFEHSRRSLLDLVETLNAKNAELMRLNRRLHYAVAARGVFLANISHELRTPLNAIIGFSTLLQRKMEGRIDPRHERFLKNILESGTRLLALINDVLDLAKIEAGRMEVILETFEVPPVLEGMRNVLHSAASAKEMHIEIETSEVLPQVTADPAKFKQIVYHLLSNAIKFSPEGAEVTVRATPLESGNPEIEMAGIRIDVIDRGIGIAPHDQKLIFDEFRQLDESDARRYQGSGLGLTLVKRLLDIQGGTIRVESSLGSGSTFSVFFPLLAVVNPEESGPHLPV